MKVLFKNKDFIVCIKPQGTPSQPDPSGCLDMTAIIGAYLRENGENDELFVVHRLDRATGGVMIYARNKNSAAELSRIVSSKDGFEKHYLAVISGIPEKNSGNMTDYLFKDSSQKKSFVVKSERKGAKLASLDYEVIKTDSKEEKTYSLLSIKLNTGRFHQIRTQLASRGMPIFADGKYGSHEKAPYLALWANKLAFSFKDKHYEFETDPEWDETPWNMFNK